MSIPYRYRRILNRIGVAALIFLLILNDSTGGIYGLPNE